MKNQYFGDINDYCKYSVLRDMAYHTGIKLCVAWMLTADDDSSDGRKLGYLDDADTWRGYDPPLFDFLFDMVFRDSRKDIGVVQTHGVIPNTVYYDALLNDDVDQREVYMQGLLGIAQGCDLVFLDPDNGLEVDSIGKGAKNSSRFIYRDEVRRLFDAGHSLLIYQHFPRIERTAYIETQAQRLLSMTNAALVISIQSPNAVFFLVLQRSSSVRWQDPVGIITRRWDQRFTVRLHPCMMTKAPDVNARILS